MNNLWPTTTVTKHRIGVMKLVPKVHKLKGTLHKDSWKELTSRPIRGAETDPMREPSKVLYTLLQEMISTLKSRYENLSTFRLKFPVLNGCDDYIHRLDHVKLSTSKSMKTILLSADFSDVCTETSIERLKESIKRIGELIDIPYLKIDLMVKLVSLVFNNCYFYTPFGLFRQTRGMPMGDVSSR